MGAFALPYHLHSSHPSTMFTRRANISLHMAAPLRGGCRCSSATMVCGHGPGSLRTASMSTSSMDTIFNPTDEHGQLREMVRAFTEKEVEPQAIEYNRDERFNMDLFKQLGDLGLLGVTVS